MFSPISELVPAGNNSRVSMKTYLDNQIKPTVRNRIVENYFEECSGINREI